MCVLVLENDVFFASTTEKCMFFFLGIIFFGGGRENQVSLPQLAAVC